MTKALLLSRAAYRFFKVCLISSLIGVSLKAQGLGRLCNVKINLTVHNLSIKDVFSEIHRKYGILFTYSNEMFDENRKVTIAALNQPLEKVLNNILEGSSFIWEIKDENVVLSKKVVNVVYSTHSLFPIDSVITLSGTVVDSKGHPLPGVTLSVKGTSNGTLTNEKGQFILKGVPRSGIVNLTSIGFLSRQIRANVGVNEWRAIVLSDAINYLDVSVVQAYTTTSRRYSTSSISTISAADIERKPITNVLLALQAEVPGITIQQSSGMANGGINVQIRGLNSLTKGGDPLYVIDGVPYTSQLMESVNGSLGVSGDPQKPEFAKVGNPLSFINPADIESISVLKDADATSIYGSRAASGAIIITTKKGKPGPTKFNVNIQQGFGKVTRFADLMNSQEYLKMRHEAKFNSNTPIYASDYDLNGTWDTTRYTDWQRVFMGRAANYSDYQLSSSGGNDNTSFLIGSGYHKESTVYLTNAGNEKGSIHLSISNTSLNKRLHLQFSSSYMVDKNTISSGALGGNALSYAPVAPALYNADGSLNWAPTSSGASSWGNPIAVSSFRGVTKTNNLISNLQISYKIISGLSIKNNFGYTNMQLDEIRTTPASGLRPEYRLPIYASANYSNGSIKSWIIEPQIVYETNVGNGRFQALVGSSLQYKNNYQQVLRGTGYSSDELLFDPKSATSITIPSSTATTYKYNALFGLVNYRFNDRYIINLSARRDGSSRFGENNLFHNFASVGMAWIFSEESFFVKKLPFLSFGKIQGSYGTSGNDQIGDYKFLNTYNSNNPAYPYQGVSGLTSTGIPNPNLQWEETQKMQFSLDLGVMNNSIMLNTTYFRNRSSNQLLDYALPSLTGFGGYTRNFPATIQNTGWEFSFNADIINRGGFTWTTRANFYIPQNKLVSFPNLSNSSYASTFVVGKTITGAKVYKYAGVNSQTGLYQFYTSKGELTSSPDYQSDRQFININPALAGGLYNSFSYKAFQLEVLIEYNKQMRKNIRFGTDPPGSFKNQPKSVLNAWRQPGDNATVQKYFDDYGPAYLPWNYANTSDAAYTSCTLVRIKNVSLAWNLPQNWCSKIGIQNAQFYSHAQNLFTFTNYWGMDPETGIGGGLPPLRIITIGFRSSF